MCHMQVQIQSVISRQNMNVETFTYGYRIGSLSSLSLSIYQLFWVGKIHILGFINCRTHVLFKCVHFIFYFIKFDFLTKYDQSIFFTILKDV